MPPELLPKEAVSRGALVLLVIALLASIVPSLMLGIKRAHDRDKPGWFLLVGFIPILGPLCLLIELGLLRGTMGSNRFGPNPLALMSDAPGRVAEAR